MSRCFNIFYFLHLF